MDKSESTSAGRNRRRRPRRGSRSASSSADATFKVLSQQLSRLNKTLAAGRPTINHPTFVGSERCKPGYTFTSITLKPLAAGRPTINHPTFVGSERCKPGYTFTSITLKPPKIDRGSYYGKRLLLPDSVTEFDKKLVSRIQIRVNPLPKFDSTVWVTVRKVPASSDLSVAAISAMFADGASPVLYWFISMLHPAFKPTTNCCTIFRRCALILAT
nr:hypothetical protein 2 [Toona sinensis cucumovirus]